MSTPMLQLALSGALDDERRTKLSQIIAAVETMRATDGARLASELLIAAMGLELHPLLCDASYEEALDYHLARSACPSRPTGRRGGPHGALSQLRFLRQRGALQESVMRRLR